MRMRMRIQHLICAHAIRWRRRHPRTPTSGSSCAIRVEFVTERHVSIMPRRTRTVSSSRKERPMPLPSTLVWSLFFVGMLGGDVRVLPSRSAWHLRLCALGPRRLPGTCQARAFEVRAGRDAGLAGGRPGERVRQTDRGREDPSSSASVSLNFCACLRAACLIPLVRKFPTVMEGQIAQVIAEYDLKVVTFAHRAERVMLCSPGSSCACSGSAWRAGVEHASYLI